jgi:hypothetical protein
MPRLAVPPPLVALFAALLVAGCSREAEPPATGSFTAAASAAVTAALTPAVTAAVTAGATQAGIDWRRPAGEAELDAVFDEARALRRPVFLYWGAAWCPPCNQVKATVFSRADFIEKSRRFLPVYLDGDLPAAQKLGARFRVSGYPTMVLLRPDGSELTRLPGGVLAQQYLDVLDLGLQTPRPVRALLAQARKTPAKLGAADWRLLAWYDWEADDQHLLPRQGQAAVLRRLAEACPRDEAGAADRLALRALVAEAEAKRRPTPAARERLLALLADAPRARQQLDLLARHAGDLSAALTAPATAEREQLLGLWAAALDRLSADEALPHGQRLVALIGRVELALLDAPAGEVNAVLQEHVRAQVARADREVASDIERQSVVNSAAYVLRLSGQPQAADALLTAELTRSHSPYYFMLALADNARRRGDSEAALRWAERAWRESQGPATRVQWGSSYVGYLVELAPQDAARIETTVLALLGELDGQRDALYDRTRARLERMSGKLLDWAREGDHDAVLARLRTKRDALCAALPAGDPQRAPCAALFESPARRAGAAGARA